MPWAGEIVQWWKKHAALTADQSSVPSTHREVHNHHQLQLLGISCSPLASAGTENIWCTHKQAHKHINKNKILKLEKTSCEDLEDENHDFIFLCA